MRWHLASVLLAAAYFVCIAGAANAPVFVTLHPVYDVSLALRQCSYFPYATTATTGSNTFLWQIVAGLSGSGVSFRPLSSFSRYLCSVPSTESSTGLLVKLPTNQSACTFEEVDGLFNSSYVSYKQDGKYLMLTLDRQGSCASSFSANESSLTLGTPSSRLTSAATWIANNASLIRLMNKRNSTMSLRHCSYAGFITADSNSGDWLWYTLPALDNTTTTVGKQRLTLQASEFLAYYSSVSGTRYVASNACASAPEKCVYELTQAADGSDGYISLRHVYSDLYLGADTIVGTICTWMTSSFQVNVYNQSQFSSLAKTNQSVTWQPIYAGTFPDPETFTAADTAGTDTTGSVSLVTGNSIFVTLRSGTDTSMGLRACANTTYVASVSNTSNTEFMWQLTSALDGGSGVSLRSVANLKQFLCVSAGALVIQQTPSNASTCVFHMVSALSGLTKFISLKYNGAYVSVSSSLSGGCASSLSGALSVVLAESPVSSASASWYISDASTLTLANNYLPTTSLHHCYYQGFVSALEDVDDWRWSFIPGLDSTLGENAVSISSANYVARFLGPLDGTTRLGAASYCQTNKSMCTFLLRPAQDGTTNSFSLYHPWTGKYVGIATTVSGSCASYWSFVKNVKLSSSPTLSKLSWKPTIAFPYSAARIAISSASKLHNVSSLLYGAFFEEINFAGEGGLYAELLWNRDFEARGRGILFNVTGSSTAVNTSFYPWVFSVSTGSASATLQNSYQPYAGNPYALQIAATANSVVTLSNPGFWGVNCRNGIAFKGSFYAYATDHMNVSLFLDSSGNAVSTTVALSIVGNSSWAKYTFELQGTSNAPSSHFILKAEMNANAVIYLDSISLFPGDAVEGLFRKDVFDLFAAIKPAFLRFPGGNYLEGNTLDTRWNWKNTIGEAAARAGHYNDAWGYWTTDGLGLYEYHILCKAIGAKPLMSIFTGYLLSGTYVALANSSQFAQDALDAIEYANGESNSTWGQLRVQAGHTESFNLSMIEVGNEEALPAEYATHYNLITGKVWAAYPSMEVVASGRWGASMTNHPCLSGSRCDIWDDHFYRTAPAMFALYNTYDSYTSTYPRVFVGEYAANSDGLEDARAAVAEAAFMVGFERNSNVVVMASFAPLFRHVSGTQWGYDMIAYNSSSTYVMPSYYVQKLFRQYQCEYTLSASISGDIVAVAGVQSDGLIVIKVVNFNTELVSLQLDLSAFDYESSANITTLSGGIEVNSLADPDNVQPSESSWNIDNNTLLIDKLSLAIIRIRGTPKVASSSSIAGQSSAPGAVESSSPAVESSVPITVESSSPAAVESSAPVTVESSSPAAIESSAPVIVESSTATVESSTPATVESSAPVTAESSAEVAKSSTVEEKSAGQSSSPAASSTRANSESESESESDSEVGSPSSSVILPQESSKVISGVPARLPVTIAALFALVVLL